MTVAKSQTFQYHVPINLVILKRPFFITIYVISSLLYQLPQTKNNRIQVGQLSNTGP